MFFCMFINIGNVDVFGKNLQWELNSTDVNWYVNSDIHPLESKWYVIFDFICIIFDFICIFLNFYLILLKL